MTMRAVVCEELRWPARLPVATVATPEPGPGQILVEVAAAGLNFADTLVIGGTYQEKLQPPFIPGAELAGTVTKVGADVTKFRLSDRVMGQVVSGAYAEQALLDVARAQRVPDEMPFSEAAGFFIPYGTAACGLFERGRLKPEETVLVTGAAGGVGRAAVELALARGARVIATASGAARRAAIASMGDVTVLDADHAGLKERLLQATGGKGVDIVFDVVGGELARQALRALAFEGRFVIVGFASGNIPNFPANHLLVKNVDVIGLYWGVYQTHLPERTDAMFEELAKYYRQGAIRPHIAASFPLEKINEALAELVAHKHIGKLIVDPKS
ncbi:NADPH:quinone oxidoreductase family protein [Hoeflea alexandrii]|uniref:NADPH:quinone oxidoreductase family protein n=1 Tax=Hoeflea alexandrii TaxID=288436 RepID=UPI0022AF22EA|nr:NADPH:quinone oxidoreductase family protein [Hoeflea alexandrii]MCZ4287711.1 NADPH:quinone oxidoreductase family protein [Hoeflea alexandrii]